MSNVRLVPEDELAVRGYELSVAFEDGSWHAVAWQLTEIDPETDSPTFSERLTSVGESPLAAFAALYERLTGTAPRSRSRRPRAT